MFYTGYERLENVSYVAPAPDQEIVKSSFKLNAHLEGAVAAGYVVTGYRLTKASA